MKYIIDLRIIIVCAGILSLFACNEDKGNYDYEAINRVTEIANIQESYSVEVGERLLILLNSIQLRVIRTIWIIRGIIKAVLHGMYCRRVKTLILL